ncbi:MAG: hypothetical protein V3S66_02045 [Desulfobacterales bacterium]
MAAVEPVVVETAKEQIDKLVHCCSYVYRVKPVADLAEKMAAITPGRLKCGTSRNLQHSFGIVHSSKASARKE